MSIAPVPLSAPLLLATDGSASAEVAKQLLYPLAGRLKSRNGLPPLVMLMVQPRLLPRPPAAIAPELETEPAADLSQAQQLLQAIAADVPPEIAVTLEARRGRPASEILSYARSIQAGLIAVGHQGVSTGIRDFLLGSVSAAVARYAPCPVLVARAKPNGQPPGWRHVLLVLNGSQATQAAIALTRQFLPLGIAQLTLLVVQRPLTTQYLFGPFATPAPNWQLLQALQQVQQEQSDQMLRQAEAALSNPELQLQTLTQINEPGPCICEVAQAQGVDLILLGSDRRPALGNLRLTTTGDYVIHHAPCPVLLCRSPQGDAASDH